MAQNEIDSSLMESSHSGIVRPLPGDDWDATWDYLNSREFPLLEAASKAAAQEKAALSKKARTKKSRK